MSWIDQWADNMRRARLVRAHGDDPPVSEWVPMILPGLRGATEAMRDLGRTAEKWSERLQPKA